MPDPIDAARVMTRLTKDRAACECDICEDNRRVTHLSTTRWIRRKTLQRELSHLYDAFFEARAELEMYEADARERAVVPPTVSTEGTK